jgi:GxxExxY protein
MDVEKVAHHFVDAAVQVHRALGPGLLESAYQACLAHDLRKRQHRVDCEVPILWIRWRGSRGGLPARYESGWFDSGRTRR